MNTQTIYSRKISEKEAQNDFIFILKSRLSRFPPLKNDFKLINGGLTRVVKIESYPCICRGPDKSHEHYFIRWDGLKVGDNVKIVKNEEGYGLLIN